MSRSTQITCDECPAVKKEANHWWWMVISKEMLAIVSLPTSLVADPKDKALDLCSEQCVHSAVSKYLRGELKP